MKRKIFSIFFALVLTCTLGLVMAVPAGAQETITISDPVDATIIRTDTLDTVTFDIEILSENVPHGVYGVGLVFATSLDLPAFQVWYAEAGVAQGAPGVGWWYQEYGAGWGIEPNVTLEASGTGITAAGDGASGEKVFTVTIPTTKLGGFGATYYYAVQVRTNLIGWYPAAYNWSSDVSGFASVKLLVLNEDTGNLYGTIQAAIDAASGTTLVCAPGIYNEDVTIPISLTLEGVQAGVDARGRTGDESEIVGSIKVVSPAEDVTIDGFTITGTAGGAMDGVCVRTESANVTVVNNIVNAVAVAGGYTYSGIVDLDGVTDALVECNSFSGVYDQARAPNVIRLGITGGGTVTVADNEMQDVGGGGGVGIMCTNELAIINITGNDIDHTGDGIWVWQNPSAFDTLSITNNNIYHNNACHGGSCENIDTGIKLVGTINGTVVVSGNDFLDNQIQVDNTAGVVDLEEVLDNNDFDRAVVVDREGASLLHTIWSFIQDGVDAAVAGDTVEVAAGTYPENVVILPDMDGLQLLGAGSGDTFIAPASGKPILLKGWDMLPERPLDGVRIQGFSLVTADASHAILAGSGTPDNTYYTTNLELEDIVVDGGQRGIGLNAAQGVTLNNVHLSNVSGSPEAALELTGVSNLLFTQGSIEDNDIGVRLQPTGEGEIGDGYGPNGNIQIHFTNFCGNGIAIENQDDSVDIDATNNYWCDPSGPHASPGYGDPVSGDVLYDPWLLGPFVPGAPPPTFAKTLALNIGWTLVSTDNWIDPANTVGVGVILTYNYTPIDGWFEVDPTALVPVDALYVKTVEGGGLGITYSGGYPAPSSKDLEAGWNLISSATETNAKDVLSPLRYVQVGNEQGIGLATLVSQGDYNQHTASFYLATLGLVDWNSALKGTTLNPFDGYWVYMNAAKNFGVVPGAQNP